MVADTNFIAHSKASIEALKSAILLKNLNLNVLIVGEFGTGKTTLAKTIVDAKIVDCSNFHEALNALTLNQTLILKNFHKIADYESFKNDIKLNSIRVIATSHESINSNIIDDFFGAKITLLPLKQREEDIELLSQKFFHEAKLLFLNDCSSLKLKDIELDLSKNIHSLRYSIYKAVIISSFAENDVLKIMEKFLEDKIGSGNDYREQLYLFDVPLIRAGYKKFNSQLIMSEKFGINRNTLRKNIKELNNFL